MADYDRQRAERDFNMNPPTNAPGQGGDGWGDLFSNNSSTDFGTSVSGVDTDINSILNGQQGVPGAQPNQQFGVAGNQQMGNPQAFEQSTGEKILDAMGKALIAGAKWTRDYVKLMHTSLTNNSESDWNALGGRMAKVSAVIGAGGLILLVLGLTVCNCSEEAVGIIMGCVINAGIGIALCAFNRKYPNGKPQNVEVGTQEAEVDNSDGLNNFVWDGEDSEDDYGDYSDEEESEYYSEDDWEDAFGDSFDNSFGSVDDSFFASNDSFNANEVVSNLPDIPTGQYTRQFLYETFLKVLPTIQPSFMAMEQVTEDTDEFFMFEDYLKRSADQTGISDEKYDELQLQEVRKNLFIIQLIATRPTGLKEKDIANGVADCYKRDEYGTVINGREGVFARVNSQVGRLIIDIFLCNNVMISLGDVFRQKSSFLLDANNTMPLIWGIGEMGNVFCYDGMKDGNGGIIISGEARSGKSWKGQSLIAQMCMFRSPKELELYFYDVKGDASDYAYLSKTLPHCKGFCGDSLRFNDSISSLLERECKRRTDLLAGKYTNVKDYNKDNPFNKIPTIYIVIDEMATAMSEMKDKDIEIRKKFDSLLIQIATKYPYLEIKLMLFPHRIVNDIINKTVSSMISTRSVLGNVPADELKSALDIKKDFPYSLVKTGDMAIKTKSLNNGNAVYSHSEVLSTDESTNRKIFDYIGAVWKKLEPDCKTLEESKLSHSSSKRVAKDNSVFQEDFSYQQVDAVLQDMPTGDDYLDDVDESFWDEELGNNTDSDSSFWSNWNTK